jgi:hypothetical protein
MKIPLANYIIKPMCYRQGQDIYFLSSSNIYLNIFRPIFAPQLNSEASKHIIQGKGSRPGSRLLLSAGQYYYLQIPAVLVASRWGTLTDEKKGIIDPGPCSIYLWV